jgi:hypothetical protein
MLHFDYIIEQDFFLLRLTKIQSILHWWFAGLRQYEWYHLGIELFWDCENASALVFFQIHHLWMKLQKTSGIDKVFLKHVQIDSTKFSWLLVTKQDLLLLLK